MGLWCMVYALTGYTTLRVLSPNLLTFRVYTTYYKYIARKGLYLL